MLRLMEVASQSETFVKLYLEKSKSKNVNRHELFDCPAAGDTLEVFSLDKPPLLSTFNSQCLIVSHKFLIEEIYTDGQQQDDRNTSDACHKTIERVCAYHEERCQHSQRVEHSMKCTWPQNS